MHGCLYAHPQCFAAAAAAAGAVLQITDTVYPMYKAFIEPDLKAAQLKIHNR
jgi:hypothetical protein